MGRGVFEEVSYVAGCTRRMPLWKSLIPVATSLEVSALTGDNSYYNNDVTVFYLITYQIPDAASRRHAGIMTISAKMLTLMENTY